MRSVSLPLVFTLSAGAALAGCASSAKPTFNAAAYDGSRCPPTSACAPSGSALRQYFDGSRRRYYYYDPLTYQYYWENGSPKS
jgi:hypothetical protein